MTEAPQQGQGTPAPEGGGTPDGTQVTPQDSGTERTFTQADLKKIAANEKREGKQSAISEILEKAGAESIDDVLSAYSEFQVIQEAATSEAEKLGTELEKTKNQLKTEREARATSDKTHALRDSLRDAGINPERLKGAMRLADLSALEVDKEGNVSGLDEVVESVREEAPEFFGSFATERQRINAPQINGTGVKRPGQGAGDPKEQAGQSFIDWLTAPMERENQGIFP